MIIQRHGLDCGCFSFCFFVFSGQHWLFKLGSESPAGGERHSWYPCIGSALWGAVSARVSFSLFVFYSVTFKSVTMEHVTSDCFFFVCVFFLNFIEQYFVFWLSLGVHRTCVYVLGVITKTKQGCEVLKQFGWDAVRHSRRTLWPVTPDEVDTQLTSELSSVPSTLSLNSESTSSRHNSESESQPST